MPILTYFGKSNRQDKRFVAIFANPKKTVHFGLKGANTYIDGADKKVRENYRKRHKSDLKTDDPLRAGYLSYYVIWGDSRNVEKNLKDYLKRFGIKDKRDGKRTI